MSRQGDLETLHRDCSNCRYAKCARTATGAIIAVCDNNNSKEFKNQVDRNLQCPFHRYTRH